MSPSAPFNCAMSFASKFTESILVLAPKSQWRPLTRSKLAWTVHPLSEVSVGSSRLYSRSGRCAKWVLDRCTRSIAAALPERNDAPPAARSSYSPPLNRSSVFPATAAASLTSTSASGSASWKSRCTQLANAPTVDWFAPNSWSTRATL